MAKLQSAIIVPNFGEYSNVQLLAELACRSEESGWDGFFVWDQISMDTLQPICDPWIALALIANATKRIKLGTMVTPIPRRRPTTLARQTVTLDQLSGGRLILGVGLGALQYEEFEALGDEPNLKLRAEMLDEGLEVLTGLWSGEPFVHEGKHYHIKSAQFLPMPLQPRIPVWVAGNWPIQAPFKRAARWDAVMPGWDIMGGTKQSPHDVRDMVEYIKGLRTSTEPFDVAYGGKTSGTDREADAIEVRPYNDAGVTWWMEDLNPWRGTLAQMRQRISDGPTSI